MFSKVIVVFAFLTVALAGKPYLGFRLPYDLTQVVGGGEAEKSAYPFIVSLQWGPNKNSASHFCAGSILNENWVVTAAHCVQAIPGDVGTFEVKAGKHNIRNVESTEQIVQVLKSWVHEKYAGGVGPYDIGLLKLSEPLKMTKEVQSIKLPKEGSVPQGNAILCGWGSTSQSSIPDMPDVLQYVNLEYVDIEKCDEAVRRLTGSSPVHETNVCTGPLTGGISACSGDSGGPLFEKTSTDFILTGIVSWGIIPCGYYGAPSVYTNPAMYNSWIENIINNN
ncbi:PREDICTED: trypsin-like [Dinoponera quadriceps]|uniref:chymotrypsin n=1 Tax=Dinoponera quadriceps TaxID=609295 RepID=A0A6P3XYY6_DINQU|nr:PREDICTED: trypsin-like [Dinoponera quadriceps]